VNDSYENKQSAVHVDSRANIGFIVYFCVLLIAGLVVCILSYTYHWEEIGWFIGIFLLLTGGLGVVVMIFKMGGGMGQFVCPQCQHVNKIMHMSLQQEISCDGCSTWFNISGGVMKDRITATIIALDYISPGCTKFIVPLLDKTIWPNVCPLCGMSATRHVTVKGTPEILNAILISHIVGIGSYKEYSIEVPACGLHNDPGVGIVPFINKGTKIVGVGFRSYAYWLAFCKENNFNPKSKFQS
jgi:ribosomal protein S27E